MHTYLIILEITPLKLGGIYDSLPLHCTLVHWFWLKQAPSEVAKRLAATLTSLPSVTLKASNERTFPSKNKHGETVPVVVNDIAQTSGLRDIHERTCTILENMGVQYSEPQYVRNGYHPHVTHQKDGKLFPGEVHESARLYLVEAIAPEYGNERTVRAVVDLVSTE